MRSKLGVMVFLQHASLLLLLSMFGLTGSAHAAKPGLYRCPKVGGGSSFQDLPCAGGAGSGLDAAAIANQTALRRWLREQQAAARAAPRKEVVVSGQAMPTGALQPEFMAACSVAFYECAQADGTRMQRCVQQLPVCTARRSARCCPSLALDRFRAARASGASSAQATRRALLGED